MAVVAAFVDGAVVAHDDQSSPGMHDLEIRFADGRRGAVEVTSAEDEDQRKRFGAIKKAPTLTEPALVHGWLVMVSSESRINEARARLPEVLREFERVGVLDASVHGIWPMVDEGEFDAGPWAADLLQQAHADSAKAVHFFEPGTIATIGPMRVAWLSQDPDDVVTFVERFVESRASDVLKLGRSGADERHLFIWGGVFPDAFVELRALGTDIAGLPTRAPRLPREITHVWVAPNNAPPSRIVVWSESTGWVQAGEIT